MRPEAIITKEMLAWAGHIGNSYLLAHANVALLWLPCHSLRPSCCYNQNDEPQYQASDVQVKAAWSRKHVSLQCQVNAAKLDTK